MTNNQNSWTRNDFPSSTLLCMLCFSVPYSLMKCSGSWRRRELVTVADTGGESGVTVCYRSQLKQLSESTPTYVSPLITIICRQLLNQTSKT